MKHIFALLLILGLASCVQAQPQQPNETGGGQIVAEQILVSESVSVPASTGAGSVEIIGGDEAQLREFVQRWFVATYPGAPAMDTKIYLGSLPEDAPLDLPLPQDARLIASIMDHYSTLEIILDTGMSPEEAKDFYREQLTADGWQVAPEQDRGAGFVPTGEMGLSLCLGEDEAVLFVGALELPDGLTDVRLNLSMPANGYQCAKIGPEYQDRGTALIPTLSTPPGVEMKGSGMGSSEEDAYVEATLKTEMPLGELAAHYHPQLEQAGWQMLDSGSVEGQTWSTWSITDDRGDVWGGSFILLDTPLTPQARFAVFWIAKTE